ncbi:Muscle, skeletal receptor tyrosine kinase, partial [Paramuricea clavata]
HLPSTGSKMMRIDNLVIFGLVLVIHVGQFTSGDLCSSLSADEILPCGDKTISESSCTARGCCWNETRFNNTIDYSCYRAKRYNGTCIKYPEDGVCFKYLNISVPEYRNTPRFIDYNLGLNRTNALLEEFQRLITVVAAKGLSESCLHTVRILLCQYILTPCLEDGSFIQICRRDCDMYEKQCPKSLQKLIGAAIISLSISKSNFGHVSLPDCQKLEYEEDLAKVGKKCYLTGLFNHTSNVTLVPINNPTGDDTSSDDKAAIIAPVVVIITVLAVASLLAFLLYRRRKNRNDQAKLDPGTPSMNLRGLGNFPAVSVKDHINMLTADDLLKSKMPINDVKMIKQFPVDRVAYEKDLGEGQFGQVFQGRAMGLNEQEPEAETIVAVKTLKKGSASEAKEEFNQEACLMNYLNHPNIVCLLAVSATEEPYCMIFEFMSNGDLSEYLRKSQPLKEDDDEHIDQNKNSLSQATLIHMCIDVARGLQYLASHRLIHRDVATRNCLVGDDLTIKIADFGMSRDIYSNNYYKIEKDTVLPIRWLSPEAVLYGKFTIESDIYSYGVLLWEVFTFSMQPYYGYTNKEVLEFIAKGIHLAKPDFCPNFVYPIMKKCWSKEPELRPYYDKIINAMNGEEITTNGTPKTREDTQPEYQNFVPFSDNANDADSSASNDTHEDPLITSRAQDSNKLEHEPVEKERSSTGSRGSVNSGLESDTERETDAVVRRAESSRSDAPLTRMNKTYV